MLNHVHAFATQCSPLRCQVSPVARGWIDEAESLRERRSYMRHIAVHINLILLSA